MRRALVWSALCAGVVLATRTFVYALVPQSVVVGELEGKTGNPHVLAVAVVAAAVAVLVGVAALGLVVVAVRERLALEGRAPADVPRPRVRTLALRATALSVVNALVFAYVESYLHWREGLGWHGLHCLTGPVHRDAVPFLVALSVLAVALHAAVAHVAAWARRLALAGAAPLCFEPAPHYAPALVSWCGSRDRFAGSPRGPPRGAVPVPA